MALGSAVRHDGIDFVVVKTCSVPESRIHVGGLIPIAKVVAAGFEHAAVVVREASLDVPHVEVDHVVIVHVRTGLVSGDVVVGGSHRTRECEDECRGDVRCAHGVVVEGVEGAEDL